MISFRPYLNALFLLWPGALFFFTCLHTSLSRSSIRWIYMIHYRGGGVNGSDKKREESFLSRF